MGGDHLSDPSTHPIGIPSTFKKYFFQFQKYYFDVNIVRLIYLSLFKFSIVTCITELFHPMYMTS